MTDPNRDENLDAGPQAAETPGDEAGREMAGGIEALSYDLNRAEQLEALRADLLRIRTELANIAAGSSTLVLLEADVALRVLVNKIRRHIVPAVVVAGVVGYLWTAFARPR